MHNSDNKVWKPVSEYVKRWTTSSFFVLTDNHKWKNDAAVQWGVDVEGQKGPYMNTHTKII